jgi:Tfp pilus assembly protein PilX
MRNPGLKRNHAPAPGASRRGFALLLTLGLLTLIVLLLLAVATLTRVETRVSEGALQQTQARQHAMLALNLALGRLQKFAGPDPRVTATAEGFGGDGGTAFYTGVWDALNEDPAPLTWLVSGNENDPAVTPAADSDTVELVGAGSAGLPAQVLAPRREIFSGDVPGQTGTATVGHYAWWVGDEGVKASVTLADRTGGITYAPFDAAELRQRIQQNVTGGAGPADDSGAPVFEPREPVNASLGPKTLTTGQLEYYQRSDGTAHLGLDIVRQNFPNWTPDAQAVLAATNPGGLRQDLSTRPDLLGPAFVAWANYANYMENPAAPVSPAILPDYPAGSPNEAMRRRYRMMAPVTAAGLTFGVAPVLSYFLITFNVRTDQSVSGALRPLEVRARWMATFWNPYTSALVPEDLQLEVSGLPAIQVIDDSVGGTVATLDLDSLYGAPLRISLPWQPAGRADQQSWLPGRVYTWSAAENLNKGSPPPAAGFASIFYTRNLNAAAGQGVQRAVPSSTLANSALAHLLGGASQLTVRLYHTLPGGGRELLRTHVGPAYAAFATTPAAANAATYQFSLVFHLAESVDTPALPGIWLTTAGQDPREPVVPAGSYLPPANGPRPELYPNYTSISFSDRLLDRALPASAGSTTGQSYNEDTPVFELPRAPVVSLGGLQHLPVAGARPFTIGNSWGQSGDWNRLFDRYFFSGLATGVTLPDFAAGQPLPNPFLRVVATAPDGTVLSAAALAAAGADGYTSKALLQEGAFNVNSARVAAWQAVLRSGRFTSGAQFSYLAATAATGTAADSSAWQVTPAGAVFFRFPSSAEETFQADAGYAASSTVPPAAPNAASIANTHLFRRGLRALSAEQTVALAAAIVARQRQKFADSGPYRSLDEFLNPSPLFGGVSLLERALADVVTSDGQQINDPLTVAEFSSQWLTQADLVGLLAPVLFARSDTFRIRAYGDTANPVTGAVEGRAWCEALVQRLPDYCDATQPAETPPAALNPLNQTYGRRFKIIHFQWLTASSL